MLKQVDLKTKEHEFLRLIDQHKRIIYKISKTFVEDQDERKDLSQEIIIQLWKSFDSFKQQSQFSTWMYRVALNPAVQEAPRLHTISPRNGCARLQSAIRERESACPLLQSGSRAIAHRKGFDFPFS